MTRSSDFGLVGAALMALVGVGSAAVVDRPQLRTLGGADKPRFIARQHG